MKLARKVVISVLCIEWRFLIRFVVFMFGCPSPVPSSSSRRGVQLEKEQKSSERECRRRRPTIVYIVQKSSIVFTAAVSAEWRLFIVYKCLLKDLAFWYISSVIGRGEREREDELLLF